jgi:hypothetical protein
VISAMISLIRPTRIGLLRTLLAGPGLTNRSVAWANRSFLPESVALLALRERLQNASAVHDVSDGEANRSRGA